MVFLLFYLLEAAVLALALSLDTFAAGISLGARRIRIPAASLLALSLTCSLSLLVSILLGGLLGLAMSYGAMLLLRDWLLVTSLGKTGLSTGMFNGAVFIAAFLFCLVLNLFSAGLPAWRMSRLNITDSING